MVNPKEKHTCTINNVIYCVLFRVHTELTIFLCYFLRIVQICVGLFANIRIINLTLFIVFVRHT